MENIVDKISYQQLLFLTLILLLSFVRIKLLLLLGSCANVAIVPAVAFVATTCCCLLLLLLFFVAVATVAVSVAVVLLYLVCATMLVMSQIGYIAYSNCFSGPPCVPIYVPPLVECLPSFPP